jgi:hypothetical protein
VHHTVAPQVEIESKSLIGFYHVSVSRAHLQAPSTWVSI